MKDVRKMTTRAGNSLGKLVRSHFLASSIYTYTQTKFSSPLLLLLIKQTHHKTVCILTGIFSLSPLNKLQTAVSGKIFPALPMTQKRSMRRLTPGDQPAKEPVKTERPMYRKTRVSLTTERVAKLSGRGVIKQRKKMR